MTLERQLETFLEALPRLLREHGGEYAVVYDGEVTVHKSLDDAVKAGFEKCGHPSGFLLRRIEPH